MQCERLHVRLAVSACARRWRQAQDGEVYPESLGTCLVCTVGAANQPPENSNG